MGYPKTDHPTKQPNQPNPPTIKRFNVTDLMPTQRRELFTDCLNQSGFVSFIKTCQNKQTYYTFKYQNHT